VRRDLRRHLGDAGLRAAWPKTNIEMQIPGWLAAGLTLATFVCRDLRRLRLLALATNAAFIGYGAAAQLLPVLTLHLALVPVNLWRLNQAFRPAPARSAPASPAVFRVATAAPCRRPRSWRAASAIPRREQDGAAMRAKPATSRNAVRGTRHPAPGPGVDMPKLATFATLRPHDHHTEGTRYESCMP
jgi:hypothetical protein